MPFWTQPVFDSESERELKEAHSNKERQEKAGERMKRRFMNLYDRTLEAAEESTGTPCSSSMCVC